VNSETRLLHPRVLDDVHVVEPDVLHTAGEVLPRHEALSNLEEVVQSADMDLTFITNRKSIAASDQNTSYITSEATIVVGSSMLRAVLGSVRTIHSCGGAMYTLFLHIHGATVRVFTKNCHFGLFWAFYAKINFPKI